MDVISLIPVQEYMFRITVASTSVLVISKKSECRWLLQRWRKQLIYLETSLCYWLLG